MTLELSIPAVAGRPAVVAPPHPLYGGHMDNRVVVTVARALARCGHAPLRFNWRGVGDSGGTRSGRIEDAEEDYRWALAQAAAGRSPSSSSRIVAAGYSFGAVAALRAAAWSEDNIERLVLVAPPAQMIEGIDLRSIERPVQVIVGDRDPFASVEVLANLVSAARDAHLDVVPDADHFFGFPPCLDRLGALVCGEPHEQC
jgi:uncharacterized protein